MRIFIRKNVSATHHIWCEVLKGGIVDVTNLLKVQPQFLNQTDESGLLSRALMAYGNSVKISA